jgi:hypothetical protein
MVAARAGIRPETWGRRRSVREFTRWASLPSGRDARCNLRDPAEP